MINPNEEILILEGSCTKDVAVAKLLGWMQGHIRQRFIKITEQGISFDQLEHMYSMGVPLVQFLGELKEDAMQNLDRAVEAGEDIDELCMVFEACEELSEKASSFWGDIDAEIAKGESSTLKINQQDTDRFGEVYITIRSLEQWAQEYGIFIEAPTSMVKINAGQQVQPPSAKVADINKKSGQGRTKMRDQEAAILDAIKSLEFDPMSLPKNESGKDGVKSVIRNSLRETPLFDGTTIFDAAWERLSGRDEIAYVK